MSACCSAVCLPLHHHTSCWLLPVVPPPPRPRLLCVLPGDDAIKHLLSRGAHRRFGYKSLMLMLAWYFMFAAMAAGSAISSGLFVPMLMMGATVGRLVGLATTDIADKYGALLSSKSAASHSP